MLGGFRRPKAPKLCFHNLVLCLGSRTLVPPAHSAEARMLYQGCLPAFSRSVQLASWLLASERGKLKVVEKGG